MGGALAFCAAQHAGPDCVVPFYGIPPPTACQTEKIKVPVQAHFGKLDSNTGFSDPETAQKIEQGMITAESPCEFHYYEGAGHSFMSEGKDADELRAHMGFPQPQQHHRDEAWKRVMHFFAEHLRGI